MIPRLGRSSVEGNGNALQSSCLGNPKDRGASWATVYGVTKSWTRLKRLSTHRLGLNKHQLNWESEALCEKPRIEEALQALGLNKHQLNNWESEALCEKPRIEEALRCPLEQNSTGCRNHHSVH